jgi:hypothetical protein
MPKWVGFDMDECIGSLMPLYAFVTKLPKAYIANGSTAENAFENMKSALYLSENYKMTWLVRPAFYDALLHLYNAYKRGVIYGAFIFSNNGSQELVDFMVYYCNGWMARKFNDFSRPAIFKMGVCRGSPLRSPGSLVKSLSEIQTALARKGLPRLEKGTDLLFFDDMVHVLSGEIKDYVQVRPYLNLCPLEKVVVALSGLEDKVGSEAWRAIVRLAQHYSLEDRDAGYVKLPPTVKEILMDKMMFHQAFGRFLDERVSGGKRRYSRKASTGVRKNTLRHRRRSSRKKSPFK